ncbi:MAG: hypothetical protein ABIK33_05680 [candidate division WOR-3 bacterium]
MIYIRIGDVTKEITMEEFRSQIENDAIPPDTPICSKTIFGDELWRKLGATSLYQRIKSKQEVKIESLASDQISTWDTPFGTLLGYGKFISFIGWVFVFIGVIVIIVALVGALGRKNFSIMGILPGVIIAISGIMTVASGQVISCFVAIEKNTRKSKELIEKFLSQSK